MADNKSGLPVQTLTGEFVGIKLYDDGGTNIANVDASGRLSVDASGVAVPVTDNGGSLTVDGTVGITGTVDTELAAAAALADNTANPTVTSVGTFPHWFDGTTWDRAPGTAADGLLVNLGANNDVVVSGVVDTELTTADLDTGAGTDTRAVIGLVFAASGGAVLVSATDPLPVTFSGGIDTELPAAAALTDNFANPTAPAVGAFTMVWDGAAWDRAPGNTTDGLLVNLGANNDVTITGTVDTELATAAALADDTANPTITSVGAFLMGFDGTNWDRVRVANTGRLQVDVITAPPSSGGLTDPTYEFEEAVDVGAGASADIDMADITTATTGRLHGADFWSAVPYKVQIRTVTGGTPTTRAVVGALAGQAVHWRPPDAGYITHAGGAGNFFRFRVTNLDDVQASSIYATGYWDEA